MTDNQVGTADVLNAYLEALTAGDLGDIARFFASDATWTLHGTLPLAGTYLGRSSIMEFLDRAGGLYQPGTQRFFFGDATIQDGRAVLEWRVQAIASATGLAYDNSYCGVFVIAGGEITAVREYLDSLHAADILYPAKNVFASEELGGRDLQMILLLCLGAYASVMDVRTWGNLCSRSVSRRVVHFLRPSSRW